MVRRAVWHKTGQFSNGGCTFHIVNSPTAVGLGVVDHDLLRNIFGHLGGPAIMSTMASTREAPKPPPSRLSRLFGRWWRRQSAARQDRFVTIAPLISVLLFLAAITAAFWYLRNEEIQRTTEALRRDTEISQQQIR
eukprot:gene14959-20227_t